MSTTLDKRVAFTYGAASKVATILEIRMGMVDRGADVMWLSQARDRTPPPRNHRVTTPRNHPSSPT